MSENSVKVLGSLLQPHQDELHQLSEIGGIHMDMRVFRILVQFLNMGIDADTIYLLLKTIRKSIRQTTHHHRR